MAVVEAPANGPEHQAQSDNGQGQDDAGSEQDDGCKGDGHGHDLSRSCRAAGSGTSPTRGSIIVRFRLSIVSEKHPTGRPQGLERPLGGDADHPFRIAEHVADRHEAGVTPRSRQPVGSRRTDGRSLVVEHVEQHWFGLERALVGDRSSGQDPILLVIALRMPAQPVEQLPVGQSGGGDQRRQSIETGLVQDSLQTPGCGSSAGREGVGGRDANRWMWIEKGGGDLIGELGNLIREQRCQRHRPYGGVSDRSAAADDHRPSR